jgi:hypothetical protein
MRRIHYDGAPGVLTSAFVWLTAAVVCFVVGTYQGVWTLLIGGALIYPISTLLTRIWVKPQKAVSDNALNQLAAASTIWLIACCAMAYGLYHFHEQLFFPAMMITIGCRYAVFATVFGLMIYWILGLILIAAAFGALFLWFPPPYAAALGGLIEIVFAGIMLVSAKKRAATT